MSHTIYSPGRLRMKLHHRLIARLSTKRKKEVMLESYLKKNIAFKIIGHLTGFNYECLMMLTFKCF